MDNIDTILELMRGINGVIVAECRPLPADLVGVMPDDSRTFYVRQVLPGQGINGTDRDNHAEIYVPMEVFTVPECNANIIEQMTGVLTEIEKAGRPSPTFDADPVIPPTVIETPETTNEQRPDDQPVPDSPGS